MLPSGTRPERMDDDDSTNGERRNATYMKPAEAGDASCSGGIFVLHSSEYHAMTSMNASDGACSSKAESTRSI